MLVANVTTRQYFNYGSETQREQYLRDLIIPFKKINNFNKVIKMETHWRRSDHIVLVENKLEAYVIKEYGELFLN